LTESKVFTDKLEALRHCRASTGKFFETYCVDDGTRKALYVVAASEHQANLALVEFLMPLAKWDKKTVDRQYIAALEAEAARKEEALDETESQVGTGSTDAQR
jgi:hypothetical protein